MEAEKKLLKLRETMLELYEQTYNLYENTRLDELLCFLRTKKREEILYKRRLLSLLLITKSLEIIDGRASALPTNDVPVGILSKERIREWSKM